MIKVFVSLTMDAMETGKGHSFSYDNWLVIVAKKKNCFMKNMNLIDTKYQWQNWVYWTSAWSEKVLQSWWKQLTVYISMC